MRRLLASLTISSVVATTVGCASPPPQQRTWHEIRTDHFTIQSCGDEADSRALADELVVARAAATASLPAIAAADPAPTRIYIFCDGRDYTRLSPRPAQANHFTTSWRGMRPRPESTYEQLIGSVSIDVRANLIVLRHAREDARRLAKHHYLHYVLRSHADLPVWMDEGLAAFFSTARRMGDGFRLGRAPTSFDTTLPLAHFWLGRMFRADGLFGWPDEWLWDFYRNAWVFVHYLHFSSSLESKPPVDTLGSYLEKRLAGTRAEAAGTAAFETNLGLLRRRVIDYTQIYRLLVRNGKLVYAAPVAAPPDPRRASGQAIALGLSDLALRGGDLLHALGYLQSALVGDPGSAHLLAAKGALLGRQGHWDEAERSFQRAMAQSPDDAGVRLARGRHLLRRAKQQPGDPNTDLWIAEARVRFAEVLATDPVRAEALEGLARVHAVAGRAEQSVGYLARARAQMPADVDLTLRLAKALAARGEGARARALLTKVAGWVRGDRREARVHALLDSLPPESQVAVAR